MPFATLPDFVRPYRRTAVFTQDTVPTALLKSHATKEGVWALIHVTEGNLVYRITDPRRDGAQCVLTSDVTGVIEPTIRHEVEPQGSVRFFVEFHQAES